MEKVIFQQRVMEKENKNEKQYKIKVSPKENGYQARTTLDLGGIIKPNPRPESYSSESPKEAITKLVEKIQIILSRYTSKRIKLVGIEEPDIVFYVLENTTDIPKITIKENIEEKEIPTKKVSKYETASDDYTANIDIIYPPTECAKIWFKSLIARTKKQPDEENYLGMKTAESYIGILKSRIIPAFKEYQNIKDLDEDNVKELLNTINGKTQKKDVLTVIKLFFSFLKTNKYVK